MIYIDKLEWNVIYYSINERKIKTLNVFHHCRFKEDVDKLLHKTNLSKEEFAGALLGLVMYYFWAKAEWEVLIRAWCGGNGDEEIKIDVATQLKWNWDKFVDYVWTYKHKTKHGCWIYLTDCANQGVYCSVCNKKVYKSEYANQKIRSKYCPNCGSIMDEDVDTL